MGHNYDPCTTDILRLLHLVSLTTGVLVLLAGAAVALTVKMLLGMTNELSGASVLSPTILNIIFNSLNNCEQICCHCL